MNKILLAILLMTLAGCVVIPSGLQPKNNSYYNGNYPVNVYTLDGYQIYGYGGK